MTYRIPENLLTYENAKTSKGEALGVLTGILYLAPSDLSGVDLCPKASDGCRKACLFSAGRGAFKNVHDARMNKSMYWLQNREGFVTQLKKEIERAKKRAQVLGLKLAIRLNGTSDIVWESLTDIIQSFPEVQFYDYTKILARLKRSLPKNYHLTFSRSEMNDWECVEALKLGFNVAAVFDQGAMIGDFVKGFNILDGDLHDIRFLDAPNSIVALRAKGKARKDDSGFVVTQRKAA